MKTIFITSFHQHISRNILLSDFFEIIKKEAGMHIVLFVPKHKENYFKDNFESENVVVEGVKLYLASKTFFGLFFKRLSRVFFNTGTTKGKRMYKYYWDRKLFYFIGSGFVSFFGRFFLAQRLVRWLDYHLSPRGFFDSYIEKYVPNLVFSTDVHNENDVALMQDARRNGIKVIAMWRSWDNPTQQILRVFPDKLICGSEELKRESLELHNYPEGKIIITGHPHYDRYLEAPLKPREEFFKEFGLNIGKQYIFFAPGGNKIIKNNDVDFYALKILAGTGRQIFVRYPLGENIKLIDEKKWPDRIRFDKPGLRFSKELDFEMRRSDDDNLINQIYYASLVITGPTSIPLDAALADRPIIVLDIYPNKRNRYEKGWGFLLDHVNKLLDTGGVWHVKTRGEFIEAVESYLKDPGLHKEGREKIRKMWFSHADGKASERLAKVILAEI